MRTLLVVASGLAGVTHDGQGSVCEGAYEQEFAPAGSTYTFDVLEDGCYRVDVFQPGCDFAPGALDVHYCKGRLAQVYAGADVKGWVPVGVWPFYAANGGALEFQGAHDAARVVKVSSLENGCAFAEPRFAHVHLGEVADAAALRDAAAQALEGWGPAVVLGVDAARGIVDLELREDAAVGLVAPLCALATGCQDCAACVEQARVVVQEAVGDLRQVEPVDQRVQLQARAPQSSVLALPGALTFDAAGQACPTAYGKAFSPAAKEVEFAVPQDGCYRVEVYRPAGCPMGHGALDVHYCKGLSAKGLEPFAMEGWVPVGVWPFYANRGGKLTQRGAHDASRVVYAGSLARGCRFEAPRLARVHLAADYGRVADPVSLAKQAERVLRKFGPMTVLGVSEGSVVLDVELHAGAASVTTASAVAWFAPLCDLVQGGPACAEQSSITIQGFDGDFEPQQAGQPGRSAVVFFAVLATCLACGGLAVAAARAPWAKARPAQPVEPKADVEAAREQPDDAKPPQQDDDLCSTATPSTAPDLDQSLQSGKSYTCGKTGLGVTTV